MQEPIKCVVVGEAKSGKTALGYRFRDERYQKEYNATIGLNFFTKDMKQDDTAYALQIWDTAGEERFQGFWTPALKEAKVILITVDLNNENALTHATEHLNKIRKTKGNESTPIILIGTKSDTIKKTSISPKCNERENQLIKFAEEKKITYFSSSAATGKNVQEIFQEALKQGVQHAHKEDKIFNTSPPQNLPTILQYGINSYDVDLMAAMVATFTKENFASCRQKKDPNPHNRILIPRPSRTYQLWKLRTAANAFLQATTENKNTTGEKLIKLVSDMHASLGSIHYSQTSTLVTNLEQVLALAATADDKTPHEKYQYLDNVTQNQCMFKDISELKTEEKTNTMENN